MASGDMARDTSERSEEPATESADHPPRGWDSGAFWYPTPDRHGVLLGIAVLLFVLHFDELFGLHTNATLLFGWLPVEFGYQIVQGLLHVAFFGLLYLEWPTRTDRPANGRGPQSRSTPTDGGEGPVEGGE